MNRAKAFALRAGFPERASARSAPVRSRRPPFTPSQRSGSGSHERERWPTQGSEVSSLSLPVISWASVRPARFAVAEPGALALHDHDP
jgi:hypothetical protein